MVDAANGSSPERRLLAEWSILQRLAERNPGRLAELVADDMTFRLILRGTPGLRLASPGAREGGTIVTDHVIRIHFPRFFPAAAMELYLDQAVEHPNVHPETGFVCLWDRHRVSNTVEHALLKTVAILGWRLHNSQPVHVMQPAALQRMRSAGPEVAKTLASPALEAVSSYSADFTSIPYERRRRLS